MVDVTAAPTAADNGLGGFMGRTRGALRSMRSVLGGGGEYLQGLGTRLGSALSSSVEDSSDPTTSPSTQTSRTHPHRAAREQQQKQQQQGSIRVNGAVAAETEAAATAAATAAAAKVEFEARRKLRFGNGTNYEDYDAMIRQKIERQEMSRCARISRRHPGTAYEDIRATSRSAGGGSRAVEPRTIKTTTTTARVEEAAPGAVTSPSSGTSEERPQKPDNAVSPSNQEAELEKLNGKVARAPNRYQTVVFRLEMPSSSGSTSDAEYGQNVSSDSTADGRKDWQRSGSSASIQSWASSLSADSQSEEAAVEFMKMFVPMIFESPCTIEQRQKANFSQMLFTEAGRIWFARVVNARRARPCVSEDTFYSLAQYFALALFECLEADDFAPAKSLMNMCFTFYHEVEVPGIEPYREYLYTNLRVQPIWTSMRFWTAAFFDAVQCERAAKPVPPRPKTLDQEVAAADDRRFHANIVFGQLGTFTCNMHAFGLPRNLCLEFLRKQCIIANLTPDQQKMLRDNIGRMYDDTEPWRS